MATPRPASAKKHVEPPSVYPFDFEPEVNARNGVELARTARDFWAAHSDQPFYMHVGFTDPHRAGRGFGNENPYPDVPETQYSPDDVVVPPYLPDVPDVRADLAEYYQAGLPLRLWRGLSARRTGGVGPGRRDLGHRHHRSRHALPRGQSLLLRQLAITAPLSCGHRASLLPAPVVSPSSIGPISVPRCTTGAECPLPEICPVRSLLPGLADPSIPDWEYTFFSHCFHEVVDYNPYRVLRGRRYKFVRNLAAGLTTMLPTDLFRSDHLDGGAARRDSLPWASVPPAT